jgi:RNA recognition motif-containing protein
MTAEQLGLPKESLDDLGKSLTDPEFFAKFLLLPTEKIYTLIHMLANNSRMALLAHNIRVREIWVGNLPNDITEKAIKSAFGMYGNVDKIEIFQKTNQTFCFLRYERADEANKAFDNSDKLSKLLRANLKMSYSDFLKRNVIVGNDVN